MVDPGRRGVLSFLGGAAAAAASGGTAPVAAALAQATGAAVTGGLSLPQQIIRAGGLPLEDLSTITDHLNDPRLLGILSGNSTWERHRPHRHLDEEQDIYRGRINLRAELDLYRTLKELP